MPQHEAKSCTLRFSDPGYSRALTNPPTAFSSSSPQPAYRLLCEAGRRLDSSPALSLVFSQLIFKVHFHSVFVPRSWDWHNPQHTSNRSFHVSTSCSTQGTLRDHLFIQQRPHMDAHSAKTQTCFQQELTQRSVHITKREKKKKHHSCLLAAGLDQA